MVKFHTLFRRYIFGKTTGEWDHIDHSASLGLSDLHTECMGYACIKHERWGRKSTNYTDENLFRLIFKTQIHIQIHICYFKSLPNRIHYQAPVHKKTLSKF